MTRTSRALVAHSVRGPSDLKNVQLHELLPDEALFEIHAAGTCHVDLARFYGKIPAKFPNSLISTSTEVLVSLEKPESSYGPFGYAIVNFAEALEDMRAAR